MTEPIRIALHLQSGLKVETVLDVPADIDDRELDELIHATLTASERGSWQQLGDVHFHTGAVQAVELL